MSGHLVLTEEQAASWETYLGDFEKRVWPIFQKYGYSRDAALTCWMANRLYNALDPDDGEDWT